MVSSDVPVNLIVEFAQAGHDRGGPHEALVSVQTEYQLHTGVRLDDRGLYQILVHAVREKNPQLPGKTLDFLFPPDYSVISLYNTMVTMVHLLVVCSICDTCPPSGGCPLDNKNYP